MSIEKPRPLAATILAINLALLIWVSVPDALKQRARRSLAEMVGAR
jgi:hypothetical protein